MGCFMDVLWMFYGFYGHFEAGHFEVSVFND